MIMLKEIRHAFYHVKSRLNGVFMCVYMQKESNEEEERGLKRGKERIRKEQNI